MKTILYVLVLMSLFAMAPGCPGGLCPPPTEPPPVITEPPEQPTEPSENPGHGVTPEPKDTPESPQEGSGQPKQDSKVILLPSSGYGPQPARYELPALILIGLCMLGILILMFGIFMGKCIHEGTRDLDGAADMEYDRKDHRQ